MANVHKAGWYRKAIVIVGHAGAVDTSKTAGTLNVATFVQRVALALPGRGVADLVRAAARRSMPAVERIAAATVRIADAGRALLHMATIGGIAHAYTVDARIAAIAAGGIARRLRRLLSRKLWTRESAPGGIGIGVQQRTSHGRATQAEHAFEQGAAAAPASELFDEGIEGAVFNWSPE